MGAAKAEGRLSLVAHSFLQVADCVAVLVFALCKVTTALQHWPWSFGVIDDLALASSITPRVNSLCEASTTIDPQCTLHGRGIFSQCVCGVPLCSEVLGVLSLET